MEKVVMSGKKRIFFFGMKTNCWIEWNGLGYSSWILRVYIQSYRVELVRWVRKSTKILLFNLFFFFCFSLCFVLKDFQLKEICDRNINLSFSVEFAKFNEKMYVCLLFRFGMGIRQFGMKCGATKEGNSFVPVNI